MSQNSNILTNEDANNLSQSRQSIEIVQDWEQILQKFMLHSKQELKNSEAQTIDTHLTHML